VKHVDQEQKRTVNNERVYCVRLDGSQQMMDNVNDVIRIDSAQTVERRVVNHVRVAVK
jgi:hypothetical protein